MKQLVALAALALGACNPAQVGPARPGNEVAAPAAHDTGPRNEADRDVAAETAAFAANGTVRCVTRAGWATRDCAAGLVRNAGGDAVVTVFHPEGRSRDILFDRAGRATGVRTAEADGSDRQPFSASRAGGVTTIRLGPERYEVPDALLRGD